MKYLILIHGNPTTRDLWLSFSDEERAQGLRAYAELGDDLVTSGEMIVSEALGDPSTGVRLPARDDAMVRTDGPFAETKEYLAGFFLLECASLERALAIAERVPESEFGLVEVRPVLTLTAPDL